LKVYINQPQHLTEIKWTSIIVLLFYPSQYTKRSMYPDQNNNIINVHSLFLTRDKHTNRRIWCITENSVTDYSKYAHNY